MNGNHLPSASDGRASQVPYILATPMFPFANQLTTSARPAHIQYLINHTFTIPSTSASHQDKSVRQVFAVVKWPQVHPQQEIMGKPVQVWCHSLYEPIIDNRFLPIENISSRVIIAIDKLNEEKFIVVIPLVWSTIYVVSEYLSYFQWSYKDGFMFSSSTMII